MLKFASTAVAAILFATSVQAGCYGTGAYTRCSDGGNSYSVQRSGNTTSMQGYSADTGSSWSQRTTTYGTRQ